MKLEEIDPPLERDEEIKVIEIDPIKKALLLLSYIYDNELIKTDINNSLIEDYFSEYLHVVDLNNGDQINRLTIDGWNFINNLLCNI